MMNKFVLKFLIAFILSLFLAGCSSSQRIKVEMEMIRPILEYEYDRIIESIPNASPVAVWWCFDERFESSEVQWVSDISNWVQRSFEMLLVDSRKFRVVTRIHLEKIFEEQRFQLTGVVDEETIAAVGRILGARYMVVPTITSYNSLDVQILNSETGEILYVSNTPMQRTR
jgi:curli biogenesis system outer membrane secretion channel CsgG